jgi:hypothetical protein
VEEAMKATKFTIDRSKWACGPNGSTSVLGNLLRDDDGRMCCLGFYAIACGATEKEILGRGDYEDSTIGPSTIAKLPTDLVKPLPEDTVVSSTVHDKLIRANDAKTTRARREARIKKLFKSIGVTLRFAGRYA